MLKSWQALRQPRYLVLVDGEDRGAFHEVEPAQDYAHELGGAEILDLITGDLL